MKLNRCGCTRLVIELENVVIKIPNFTCQWYHFLKGLLANMNESKTWKCNSYSRKKLRRRNELLCPVIWCSWGGWILIMKKVRVLSIEEWENNWRKEWGFIDRHKKYFPGDDTISNYGILNNRVVKIDYGQ